MNWDLSKPAEARDFLKQVRIGPEGVKLERLTQADGREVTLDEASDEQILQVAGELGAALYKRAKPRRGTLRAVKG